MLRLHPWNYRDRNNECDGQIAPGADPGLVGPFLYYVALHRSFTSAAIRSIAEICPLTPTLLVAIARRRAWVLAPILGAFIFWGLYPEVASAATLRLTIWHTLRGAICVWGLNPEVSVALGLCKQRILLVIRALNLLDESGLWLLRHEGWQAPYEVSTKSICCL